MVYGGRSSVGRALDCGSGCRGFESHRSPHFYSVPVFPIPASSGFFANVAELVDALDLGSSAFGRGSSNLPFRTILILKGFSNRGETLFYG